MLVFPLIQIRIRISFIARYVYTYEEFVFLTEALCIMLLFVHEKRSGCNAQSLLLREFFSIVKIIIIIPTFKLKANKYEGVRSG